MNDGSDDGGGPEVEAALLQDVQNVVFRHGMAIGFVGGGMESSMLLEEAVGCYLVGRMAAAIVCAHASCERELAGRLEGTVDEPPAGSGWWGIGRLVGYASDHGWYSAPTIAALDSLNSRRKDLYHFSGRGRSSLVDRTYEQTPWRGKHHMHEDMWSVLRSEALEALDVALMVRTELIEDADTVAAIQARPMAVTAIEDP